MTNSPRAQASLRYFKKHEAWMEDRIANGIEANRKGWLKLRFTDEAGNPLENVRVKLEQQTHDFKFGCNLFMLDELETEEKNETFKEMYPKLFNLATLPFYWAKLELEPGQLRFGKDSVKNYRRPAPDLCIEFCEKHGIEPREHGLAYEQFFPKWLYGADTETVKTELERRYK